MLFTEFKLKPFVMDTLKSIKFKVPTKIQEEVIPLVLQNKSVIGKSMTGSGKTHAFLIPIMNEINTNSNLPQVLIISPTRELAYQIFKMARDFKKFNPDIRIELISGGLEKKKMLESLKRNPHIIIATPGRILDLIENDGAVNLKHINTLVLDEADMIMENCFNEDLFKIFKALNPNRKTLAFSATINKNLKYILKNNIKNPVIVDINPNTFTNGNISYYLIPYRNKNKVDVIENIFTYINPIICLIFVSKIADINKVYLELAARFEDVGILHADLTSRERDSVLKRIKDKKFRFIVCSDVVSRGIDINGVTHIINYDLPQDLTYFYHRAGRTARAGLTGHSYTLYDEKDKQALLSLIKNGVKFEHIDFVDGQMKTLRPYVKRFFEKPETELDKKIKTIKQRAPKKVKPGYKKKVEKEIAKVKQKHRREVIKKDIKKRQKERAIERQRELKNG